jgi:hypothetical protein
MMSSRKVIEFEHRQIIGINLAEDMGARVVISGGDEHSGIFFSRLRIEHGGKEIWITSEEDIVQKEMPSISDAMIIRAEALENGDLLMKLSNEVTLFFPHSDDIESWELRWLNGKQIISLPGGGFAEF